MKKRNIFIGITLSAIVLLGVLVLNFISSSNTNNISKKVLISADYPKYDNLDNLIDRADTVILGKIVDMRYEELNVAEQPKINDELNNPGGELDETKDVYTVYDVKIVETYKGGMSTNEIIKVKQLGGVIGNTEYVLEDYENSNLENNREYILFLETYENSPASLLNPIQASYEVQMNKEGKSIDTQYIIKPNLNNDINFTITDLINSDKLK